MYDEEDDDLPLQYRRSSTLHPSQPCSAFHERINNSMFGQIGMRTYLHEAIYRAKQNTAQHRHFNTVMLQQQQNSDAGLVASPSPTATQSSWPSNQTGRSDPIVQIQSFSYSPSHQQADSPTFAVPDARGCLSPYHLQALEEMHPMPRQIRPLRAQTRHSNKCLRLQEKEGRLSMTPTLSDPLFL